MAKKKNKSFVEIKDSNKTGNEENILDPFKKYEYVEEKKKFPIKKILFVLFTILAIVLIIILIKIISIRDNKIIKNDDVSKTKTTTEQLNLSTTTKVNEEDIITETLFCSSSTVDGNLQMDTNITAKFHDKKLRSDINNLHIKLLDENAREEFDNYVTVLQMFSLYLAEEDNYNITNDSKDNEYDFSIQTTYSKDQEIESNLSYDEDYDSVRQKLIELGHSCQ